MRLSTMGFRCWVSLALSGAVVHILISLHSHVTQCIRVHVTISIEKRTSHIQLVIVICSALVHCRQRFSLKRAVPSDLPHIPVDYGCALRPFTLSGVRSYALDPRSGEYGSTFTE